MKHIMIFVLLASITAVSQETFWTKQMIVAQSVQLGLHTADAIQTCHNLSRGGHEDWLPSQSCAGTTAFIASNALASVGISYMLHRAGHNRLAVFVPWITAGQSSLGIGYSFWPRRLKHWVCVPSSTHSDCHLE